MPPAPTRVDALGVWASAERAHDAKAAETMRMRRIRRCIEHMFWLRRLDAARWRHRTSTAVLQHGPWIDRTSGPMVGIYGSDTHSQTRRTVPKRRMSYGRNPWRPVYRRSSFIGLTVPLFLHAAIPERLRPAINPQPFT